MASSPSPPPPQIRTHQSIVKLSPRYDGSIIYDSYELRAMTCQVNRALQGLKWSSPHPAYVTHKGCIVGPRAACREYIGRLWKKATKMLLFRNLQGNKSRSFASNEPLP
ncbi:unnamed protein product [Linum trigynum]|uniref:Uncharacterized protein n=1 Tax=Linum trigynum TaxID=586398 RepID=A0AAV2GND9_9ROSI